MPRQEGVYSQDHDRRMVLKTVEQSKNSIALSNGQQSGSEGRKSAIARIELIMEPRTRFELVTLASLFVPTKAML